MNATWFGDVTMLVGKYDYGCPTWTHQWNG